MPDDDRYYRLPMSVGYILGCLSHDETINWLKERGVTDRAITDCKEALFKVTAAFYERDEKTG